MNINFLLDLSNTIKILKNKNYILFLLIKNDKRFIHNVHKKFGELYKPRTRLEKKNHLEVIDNIFFDMTKAIEEKEKIEKIEFENEDKTISDMFLNHNFSKKNEIIKYLMRYCIELKNMKNKEKIEKNDEDYLKIKNKSYNAYLTKKYDREKDEILITLKNNIIDYRSFWNSCEIGIILKCFLKIKIYDLNLINILLNEYFKRNMIFSEYGSLYVLYTFSKIPTMYNKINQWKLVISDVIKKLNRYELKNICLISNYISNFYNYDKIMIKNSIEEICKHIIKYNENMFKEDDIHYIANSCARVNYLNKDLFIFLEKLIKNKIDSFSFDQIVSLTNAYSKFKNAEESNFLSLFLMFADNVIKKSYLLKPIHLSVLSNSFNTACILHEHLFQVISETSFIYINEFEPKQIVMLIHSYVNIGLINNKLLNVLWTKIDIHINDLTLQEIGMILQSYTKSGAYKYNLLDKIKENIFSYLKLYYPYITDENNLYYNYNNNLYKECYNFFIKNNIKEDNLDHISMIFFLLYYENYFFNCISRLHSKEECKEKSDNILEINNSNIDANKTNIQKNNVLSKNITKNEKINFNMFEKSLIKNINKYLNPTLLCSILYSLIKGSTIYEYYLITSLTKIATILIKEFKISELANICYVLSEIYIIASDDMTKQNHLMIKNDIITNINNENGDIKTNIYNENKNIKTNIYNKNIQDINIKTCILYKNQTNLKSSNNKYNEKLYKKSKEYLITCEYFFDHVEIYLKQKELFKDVFSMYKFITSFGSLRLNKYANVSLHLFKLCLIDIKILTYLPLQKIANAFIQMNVYDEDIYSYINKLQKMKIQKK